MLTASFDLFLKRHHVQIQLHLGVPEDWEVRLQLVSARIGVSGSGTQWGSELESLQHLPCWLQY